MCPLMDSGSISHFGPSIIQQNTALRLLFECVGAKRKRELGGAWSLFSFKMVSLRHTAE